MSKRKVMGLSVVLLAVAMVLSIAGLMIAIAVMPDFEPPVKEEVEINEEDPIWEATFEDLVTYLQEKGFIGKDSDPISEGIATEARVYGEVEIYWWDVDNLVEGSPEYQCWTELQNDGYIMLYGQYIFVLDTNGPFGVYVHELYTGDPNALRQAFQEFPKGELNNED